jgi:hypothetical protein
MPFITGDTEVLLVDNGPEAEEHRWMPVGQLLYVVVRFGWNSSRDMLRQEDSTIVELRESVVER